MKHFIFAAFFITLSFSAGASEIDVFPKTYAVDQQEITHRSIEQQGSQTKAISEWNSTEGFLATALLQKNFNKKQFDRATSLYSKQVVSKTNFALKAIDYYNSEIRVVFFQNLVIDTKTEAQLAGYRVVAEGNLNADLRGSMIDLRSGAYRSKVENLKRSLAFAEKVRDICKAGVEQGQQLIKSRAISEVDLEAREMALQEATQRIESTKTEIKSLEDAVQSHEELRKRLEKN